MDCSRGSIWRKWDLHVHTRIDANYSFLGVHTLSIDQLDLLIQKTGLTKAEITSQEKSLESVKYARLFIKFIELFTDVSVIAITDHNRGDELDYLINEADCNSQKLSVFPGVEFCSNQGIHSLSIFDPQKMWRNTWKECIDHLLTSIGIIKNRFDRTGQPISSSESSQTIMEKTHAMGGVSIFAHIETENGLFYRSSTASGGKAHIDIYTHELCNIVQLPMRSPLSKGVENIIAGKDPQYGSKSVAKIRCSDSRKLTDIGASATWIKADPTFDGFRHILNEPGERIFLGEYPAIIERVERNQTKYIRSIAISKNKDSNLAENWFDFTIPLHPGLIAVIGNKGSGKSALTDTLGLIGNSAHSDAFSFLNAEKFRRGRSNKARHFEAILVWENGEEEKRNLDEDVNVSAIETIKYIPQNYLETICNEIKESESAYFDQELKHVIFTHIPAEERVGTESLDELVKFKTDETEHRIRLLKTNLHVLNEKIVTVENRLLDEYRLLIENQLDRKRQELNSHDKAKPKEVVKPDIDLKTKLETKDVLSKITQKEIKLESLKTEIKSLNSDLERQINFRIIADKLLRKITNIKKQFSEFENDSIDHFKELGISVSDVINLEINREPIKEVRKIATDKEKILKNKLDLKNTDGCSFLKIALEKEIEKLKKQLDRPNKQYQDYKKALEKWSIKREEIIGSFKAIGSIKHFEKQLADIKLLPAELKKLFVEREEKTREIYQEIQKLTEVYKNLYCPVQEFIEKHRLARERFHLDFEASIVHVGFGNSFFKYVSQGKRGSFYGIEEGRKLIKKILSKTHFDSENNIIDFLKEVMKLLRKDIRSKEQIVIDLKEQMKQGVEIVDFYDFLFSLDYLKPRYSLRWEGKELDLLSPGERGTLLLIFYLLIDSNDYPLVIDQPEENLDNETVYKILVPCIREAKERRQVIIVTHNPNLAVVCDADQVIYSSLEKENKNKVTYETGAIENPVINQHLLDVLEGTRPAFDNRDSKYQGGDQSID